MRNQMILGLVALGLIATAPAASAYQYYTLSTYTVAGYADTCVYALTPIAGLFGFVLHNFVGTINGTPTTWTYLVIFPVSGTVFCVPYGGGFLVYFSGSATMYGGP